MRSERKGKGIMKCIVNEEAPEIIERIIDSHMPDVRQSFGSVPGTPRFEDALVSSGLPYGDNVDA